MMDGEIRGSVTFWRRNQHWQFKIEAPGWVITDLVSEARSRGLHVLNSGGMIDSSIQTVLLGTSPGGFPPDESPITGPGYEDQGAGEPGGRAE